MEDNYPKQYLYKRIVEAKLYIDKHFTESIDLDKVSGEASFSKYHFLRLFKSTYGKTPHQYLTFLRIEEAKQRLNTGISISETCYALSFESLSSFTKLFKKHIGCTPSQYANKAQQHIESINKEPVSHVPQCFSEYLGFNK